MTDPAAPADTAKILEEAVRHHRAGRLDDAERLYREVLEAAPDEPDALHLLGALRHQRGDHAAAAAMIGRAVTLRPLAPVYRYNLGNAERDLGHSDAAIAAYRREIEINPGFAKAHNNLGDLLRRRGDLDGALGSFQRAVELDGTAVEALVNLGGVLAELRRFDAALDRFRQALDLRPDSGAAHGGLATVLADLGRADEAELHFRRALDIDPGCVEAEEGLGNLATGRDRFDEAFAHFDRVRALAPERLSVYRNILPAILYHPDFDNDRRFAEHLRFGRDVAAQVAAISPPPANSREAARPLRIGWLSSDFCDHPVARNLEPVLARRDRRRFIACCYADVARPDAVTERFRGLADEWKSIRGKTDREIADLIRADRIDILVVLAGRFDDNRPVVAAFRPAPVQIGFHDAATSGLQSIDYIITDRIMTQRNGTERFVERPLRLPTFYCHPPLDDAPAIGPPPALAAGAVTFGHFGNPSKINRHVLEVWSGILRKLPSARLILKYRDRYRSAELRERIAAAFARQDVAPDRIVMLAAIETRSDHLAQYGGIDVALDTFPFNGSTTTFEALWMGVPVVTLRGDNMAGRWSAAMLRPLGLDELAARSRDDYVSIAAGLARDSERLVRLRATLRERVRNSALCDGQARAWQVQRLFAAVWRRWCEAAPRQ